MSHWWAALGVGLPGVEELDGFGPEAPQDHRTQEGLARVHAALPWATRITNTKMTPCGKPKAMNLPFADDFYHPFLVIFGDCF